jgi:hypothetical protein
MYCAKPLFAARPISQVNSTSWQWSGHTIAEVWVYYTLIQMSYPNSYANSWTQGTLIWSWADGQWPCHKEKRQAHLINVAFDSAPAGQREKFSSTLPDKLRRSNHTYVFTRYYITLQTSSLAQLSLTEARDGHAQLHAPAVLRHEATVLPTDTKIMDTGYHVI